MRFPGGVNGRSTLPGRLFPSGLPLWFRCQGPHAAPSPAPLFEPVRGISPADHRRPHVTDRGHDPACVNRNRLLRQLTWTSTSGLPGRCVSRLRDRFALAGESDKHAAALRCAKRINEKCLDGALKAPYEFRLACEYPSQCKLFRAPFPATGISLQRRRFEVIAHFFSQRNNPPQLIYTLDITGNNLD